MEPTIFKFILRFSKREQVILTLMAFASYVPLYLSFDLPKNIVNKVIGGQPENFPVDVFGVEFGQFEYLYLLSAAFLGLVIINQGFKYVINRFKGITGERMLRRLRYQLYAHVLRFPLPTFRKMSQGEIIPMITSEVEPIGGFIGDAFSQPIFQGGQLITITIFLFMQDWVMGLAAVALYPFQLYIIPPLQRRVNQLGKTRVRLMRRVADRIGETVQSAQEVHVSGAARLELARYSAMAGEVFHVRYKIYNLKFMIKFLNNFINQLGPFFFYSLGGYLVLKGDLTFGALVAGIGAQKEMATPWKELLDYYQQKEDNRIKYEQVVSQFVPAGLMEESRQLDEPAEIPSLTGTVELSGLVLEDEGDRRLVDSVSVTFGADQRVALVGDNASGRADLAGLLGLLVPPSRGRILVAGRDLAELSEPVTGRRLAYVGSQTAFFAGTLGDNLHYGLKQKPMTVPARQAPARRRFQYELNESQRSGNSPDDVEADWIDYAAAGVDSPDELVRASQKALELVDLDVDVFELGLRGTVDPTRQPEVAAAVLKARHVFQERIVASELSRSVELFDREKFNSNASVAENVLFGHYLGGELGQITGHPYMDWVLDRVGLTDKLLAGGYQVAETMVELFAEAGLVGSDLFEQFSFISAEDLPELQNLLALIDKDRLGDLKPADRRILINLPFKLVPARHRLGVVDAFMMTRLLEARQVFAANLPGELKGKVSFFDTKTFIQGASVMDNILFGKIAHGMAAAGERVGAAIRGLLHELDMTDDLISAGLGYDVGVAAGRLTPVQRQKLAIARAVLKRPDILVLSEATSSLDARSNQKVMANLLKAFEGRCLVWSLQRPSQAKGFDLVLMMNRGRLAEKGGFDELSRDGTVFAKLLAEES